MDPNTEQIVDDLADWIRQNHPDRTDALDEILGLLRERTVVADSVEYRELAEGDLFTLASPPTDVVSRQFTCVFRRTAEGCVYELSGPNDCDGTKCTMRSGTMVVRFRIGAVS